MTSCGSGATATQITLYDWARFIEARYRWLRKVARTGLGV